MTAWAGGASFNTQASNLSLRSRSAESEPRTTGSMPKCRKHSEIMALAGSLRSIKAARAEDFRTVREGAEADAKWLSMGTILACGRNLGKSEEGHCPSTKVQPRKCPLSQAADDRFRAWIHRLRRRYSQARKTWVSGNQRAGSLRPTAEQQCSIGATKAKRVGHGILDV